jgi:spermidine synthase
MVILNLPDPSTAMINRFYTREFFKEVKERLNEGGIVVTGITSAVTYVGEEVGFYAGSIYNTLKKVFPFIIIAPGEKNYFFASTSPHILTTDTKILGQRFSSRHILSEYFTPYHFEMLFPEEQVQFIKHSLEKKSGLKINTDFQPITYFYNLVLWQIFSGKKGEGNIFKHLSDRFTWYAIPLLILFFIRVVYVLFSRQRLPHHLKFNSLLAITTTGFAGMALEIILMFSFQNIYGYIYQKVGLIVALFMLGLSLGGYFMNRIIAGKERNWVKILITIQFLICLYSITLPFIIKFVASHTGSSIIAPGLEYLFMLLVAGVGWLTGLEFPLVSRIVITQEEVGTVAGWVDAFDHLGACFGALLTGTLLVPLLGTFNSCFITGILSLMSGLLLAIYLIQKRE